MQGTPLTTLHTKSQSFPIIVRDLLINFFLFLSCSLWCVDWKNNFQTNRTCILHNNLEHVLLFFCQAQINWLVTRHLDLRFFWSGNLNNSVQCNVIVDMISFKLLTLSNMKLKLFCRFPSTSFIRYYLSCSPTVLWVIIKQFPQLWPKSDLHAVNQF